MNKLIFERCNTSELRTVKEPTRIVFEIEPNLTIEEYKIACKRLAHAMGYSDKSIIKEFIYLFLLGINMNIKFDFFIILFIINIIFQNIIH